MLQQGLEFGKSPLQSQRPKHLTAQQRFEELDKLYDINPEDGRVYHKDNKEFCLGTIMVGKSNLLYHRAVDEKRWDSTFLETAILLHVDHIALESLTHYHQTTIERFLEFAELAVSDVWWLPVRYWETRHKGVNPVEERRRNLMGDSWYERMKDVMNSEYMNKLGSRLELERRTKNIYPERQEVFRAYKLCTFEHTKVIVLGQNPYYTKGTADGLAFSFKQGIPQPNQKALNVILTEIERDIYNNFNLGKTYELSYLAKQGVLLLNSCLTVEQNRPDSHLLIGWRPFIVTTLGRLLTDNIPKVFLIWGSIAKGIMDEVLQKADIPFNNGHLVLTARHPAYDVRQANQFGEVTPAYPETFSGCKHFSQTNDFLVRHKRQPIEWFNVNE